MAALQQATRTVPIVFVQVTDPVGAGFVESLARPGGNATGFTPFEYGTQREMAGAAQRDRAARDASGGPSGSRHRRRDRPVRRNPGRGAVARGGVSPVNVRDAGEIERAVTAFARGSNGGLIVTAGRWRIVHRELIITLAARHQLPAVYSDRFFVASRRPDLLRA